jgi:hypothetical protein
MDRVTRVKRRKFQLYENRRARPSSGASSARSAKCFRHSTTRCRLPQWLIPKLEKVLQRPSEDRAEGYRALRTELLEHLAGYQKETR